jgi:hypothetical protein
MPKPLARQQPSSSVAGLLEAGIAAGAPASVKSNLVDQSVYDADSKLVHNGARPATGELANITRQRFLQRKKILLPHESVRNCPLTSTHREATAETIGRTARSEIEY